MSLLYQKGENLISLINPYIKIEPAVYYIVKHPNVGYALDKVSDTFELPKKIYGNNRAIATRVWNTYVQTNKTSGILLTGSPGTGKTLIGNILGVEAIKNGLPVVVVSDIEVNIEIISFISKLKDVVIFFDEFSKNIDRKLQENSLTMFSDASDTRKLFILTENDYMSVSRFIRDRPGRIRYHIDFERVSEKVIYELCAEYGIDTVFVNSILDKHKRAVSFSFDHLQALVTEHLRYPNETIDELIDVLNLGSLNSKTQIIVTEVVNIVDNSDDIQYNIPIEFNSYSVSERDFIKNSYNITARIDQTKLTEIVKSTDNSIVNILKGSYAFTFGNNNIIEITDDYYLVTDDSKRFVGKLTRK